MNYLAHIYLSGDNDLVTIGNFIADGIKGKRYKKFSKDIQIGILLHRHIDTYTDAHKTVRLSTKRLHEKYSHYSGVIVDILYDHFLAKNWASYSDKPLDKYIEKFYDSLEINYDLLPLRIQKIMPYMLADNWLLSYASIDGISRVLDGVNRRTKNRSSMNEAVVELEEFYTEFENEFSAFFDELIASSKQKLEDLNKELHD
ncbi:acyl carrier protein phosphodiesterase [Algibacter sp.]|jgi:acyl carrier protein phosphodiesterase|uniref:acyl carrier protein phosphodiesterase n=1 Tax=uncultured Algibacter sp. TaxID=298659 RepID=UPI0023329E71|nr:acyl carrier protein phosphodiesterase [uncultured Algibacter sp.]MDB4401962.1 acyl carrier protein phosphodiesterase [Algibacter sp.]MDC1197575.1 acyl carrier protein phosphodiesterase [Algibacter sp.]